ncbi:ABC-type transport auxiliary lipoprotein family protein [Novosphingobium sp.]|uniref:ABC-type transport auxiliary lipoprotein family protein n=1 Tax=Novosphingobium sp. TaxID=1874826 RepID=UPI003342E144
MLAALIALGTGGCAVMGKADAPITLRLAPATGAAPATKPDPRSVSVAGVDATGAAAKTRYAFIDPTRPGEINQAKSLFWEVPPSKAVELALVTGLRARFAAVTGPGLSLPADLRVLTTLTRFEEVSGTPGSAVVAFDATVIEHGKVARTGTWCARAAFAGPSPSDRAQAFEAALTGATTAFAQDLASGATPAGC